MFQEFLACLARHDKDLLGINPSVLAELFGGDLSLMSVELVWSNGSFRLKGD